jgi:hypothetical protein
MAAEAEYLHPPIKELDEGCHVQNVQALWGQLMWLWNRPTIQRLRFMFSMANLSVRLPAVMAIIGTQIGLLSTQVPSDMLYHSCTLSRQLATPHDILE